MPTVNAILSFFIDLWNPNWPKNIIPFFRIFRWWKNYALTNLPGWPPKKKDKIYTFGPRIQL